MSLLDDVDLEVQEILQNRKSSHSIFPLSKNAEVALPGSPVLNSIHSDKKALLGRRRTFKNRSRARTKLADKFENSDNIESEPSVIKKSEDAVEEIAEATIPNGLKQLIEHSEENLFDEKNAHKPSSSIDNGSCFKKPPSPSSFQVFSPKLKSRNVIQNPQCKYNESALAESRNIIGFQPLTRNDVQSPVCSSQNINLSYQKNFFVSASVQLNTKQHNSPISFSRNVTCGTNFNLKVTPSDKVGSLFSHCKNGENNQNDELTLTQEIFDSGITNSQISSAFDNVLGNIESRVSKEKFPGFDTFDTFNSEQLHNKLVNVIEDTAQKSNLDKVLIPKIQNNRKHKLDGLFLPPSKRLKEDQNYTNQINSANMNANHLNIPGGFSTASGSMINVTEESLKKTKGIFSDLDEPIKKVDSFNKKNSEDVSVGQKVTGFNAIKGFSTASGSKITVTEQSLKKTKGIFDNLDQPQEKCNNVGQLFPENKQSNFNIQHQNGAILKPISHERNHFVNKPKESVIHERQQVMRNLTKNKLKFFDDLINGSETENVSDFGFTTAAKKIPPQLKLQNIDNKMNSVENEICMPGTSGFSTPKRISNQDASKRKLEYFDQMIQDAGNSGIDPSNYNRNFNSNAMNSGNSTVKKSVINQEVSRNKLKYFDQFIEAAEKSGTPETNVPPTAHRVNSFQKANSLPSTSREMPQPFSSIKVGANSHHVPTVGFSTASGRSVQVSENALKSVSDLFKNIDEEFGPSKQFSSVNSARGLTKQSSFVTPLKANNTLAPRRKKRFGGIIACKQIQVSDEQLKKAALLFNEDLSAISPLRPIQIKSNIGNPTFHSTPTKTNNFANHNGNSFGKFVNSPITPIRPERNISQDEQIIEKENAVYNFVIEDSNVIVTSPTKGEGVDWIKELETERKRLEERLKIIEERQKMLNMMKEECSKVDGRPRRGILFQKKSASKKLSLKRFVEDEKPGCYLEESMLLYITPKNAVNLHFKESSTSIRTQDGAVIIPNKEDRVGLTEMSQGFKQMPGVEERLIPKGWIENHFKWIVWKLASYERMFPKRFGGSLNVENVMQQLKYRYDREIDRAERPALRRIFEKDDAPQKRMVLCVSDIKQIENTKYELELTDGWYPIRTVIDEPLNNQVANFRIKVGTKLITSDAEIINCEGCYPLEATDLIHLKINYNSTRRARWYAKLGYQPIPGPLPVKIATTHELGGVIGEMHIRIVRCYPLKYLEKHDNYSVWLNERTEKRRAQEWDNEQSKKLERIHEEIRNRLSQCYNSETSNATNKRNITDVSNITCPQELFEIMESTNDPETLESKLSSSQKQSVIEYKRERFLKTQQAMLAEFSEDIEKLSNVRRAITSSLKLLVVDLNDNPNRSFNFFIWQPSETYLDLMTEGSCLLVYNALPRKKGDLSSGSRTVFKPSKHTEDMSIIFRRKVTEISDINELKFPYDFREFDTVGLVVEPKIEGSYQELWLTNSSGKLLVVKIFEGPSTCSLLDGIKRGLSISCCNLMYHSLRENIVHATGNHFTIFSCYSQHKHLEIGLEKFKNVLPQNLDKLLAECDEKIRTYRSKSNSFCRNNSRSFNESEEDTLISSQLSRTDIALSMIDMDKIK